MSNSVATPHLSAERVDGAGSLSMRIARWHLREHLGILAWFLATVVVFVSLVLAIVSMSQDQINLSGMQAVQQLALWVPFATGIVLVWSQLAPMVAAGGTRRAFISGTLSVAVLVGALYAVAVVALLLAERAVYDELGWRQGTFSGQEPNAVLFSGGVGAHLWGLVLVICAASVSGVIVALVFLRGSWVGSLSLPFALAPVFVAVWVADPDSQFRMIDVLALPDSVSWLVRLTLGLAAIALGVVGAFLVGRNVSIPNKK